MKITFDDIAVLAIMPPIYRNILENNYDYLNLEKELKRIAIVTLDEVREFSQSTKWSYWNTLNFAINNKRLPKI